VLLAYQHYLLWSSLLHISNIITSEQVSATSRFVSPQDSSTSRFVSPQDASTQASAHQQGWYARFFVYLSGQKQQILTDILMQSDFFKSSTEESHFP
jgi:hypothetical protein